MEVYAELALPRHQQESQHPALHLHRLLHPISAVFCRKNLSEILFPRIEEV